VGGRGRRGGDPNLREHGGKKREKKAGTWGGIVQKRQEKILGLYINLLNIKLPTRSAQKLTGERRKKGGGGDRKNNIWITSEPEAICGAVCHAGGGLGDAYAYRYGDQKNVEKQKKIRPLK